MKNGRRDVGEGDKRVSDYFHFGVEMCNVFSTRNRTIIMYNDSEAGGQSDVVLKILTNGSEIL